jgi:hypothetical protein
MVGFDGEGALKRNETKRNENTLIARSGTTKKKAALKSVGYEKIIKEKKRNTNEINI